MASTSIKDVHAPSEPMGKSVHDPASRTPKSTALPSGRRLYVRLFLGGFCWTFLQLALGIHNLEFSAGYETVSVAQGLAKTGNFANPYMTPTGPTAHVAPVYPLLMAIPFRVLNRVTAGLVITTLNAAFLGLEMCLLAMLSTRLFGAARPGVFGAILLAASTQLIPQHDAVLSAVLLLAAVISLLWESPMRAGVWAGISALTNPVSALAIAVVSLLRGWRFVAITGTLAISICLPWSLRNWKELGAPSFVRDNFGLELALSNYDDADPQLIVNPGLWKLHPSRNPTEAQSMATLGEAAYYREKLHTGVEWIKTHPGQFVRLSALRTYYYWFPPLREGWPAGLHRILLLLALAGLWLLRKHRQILALMASAAAYSLPYALVQTDVRYSVPTLWVLALLSGLSIHVLISRLAPSKRPLPAQ
ncbi:MAG: hypothetical protein ABL967_08115 [Bryobacteraceae bacterium]